MDEARIDTLTIEIGASSDKAVQEINKVTTALKNVDRAAKSGGSANPLSSELQSAIANASKVDVLTAKLESLKAAMHGAFAFGDMDKAYDIRGRILSTEAALERAKKAAEDAADGVKKIGNAAKDVDKANKKVSALGNILSSLKRIAFYRIIRGIIKSITQAFSEGLEKAYLFSSGVVGEGNRFAQAMDSIKSKGNEMKGQLGSAFIGLLTAIEPVLIQIINLVTKAADAISQFFAAFTGKTYIKAVATSAQLVDNMKSGGAAAKEWKNQLLGFDEINRLNEPSSGGGGGGANPLDGYDFADAPISDFIQQLVENIKNGDLGAAISMLFDKLSEAILNIDWRTLGTQLWEKVRGLFESIDGADSAVSAFFRTLGVAFGSVQIFTWGFITAAVEDLMAAFKKNIIDYDGDNKIGLLDVLKGIWKTRVSIAEWIYDTIIEPLARGIAEGLTGKEFSKLTSQEIRECGKSIIDGLWEGIRERYQGTFIGKLMNLITNMILLVKQQLGIHSPSTVFKDIGSNIVQGLMDGISSMWAGFSTWFSGLFGGLISWCQKAHAWIQDVMDGVNILGGLGLGSIFGSGNGFSGRGGKFAGGGFPEEGQLFLAREAGPELVGTMGGRAAVANNDQIVEGIRQGVFEAVSAAMNGGGQDVNVKVFLDSREIRAGQQRLNRAWGA